MIIRKVSNNDYPNIKSLFKRNSLKIINNDRWKNLWNKNPILNNKKKWTKGWVIVEDKKIVGHFGSFPTQYFHKKKTYICSVLHGWVVDKKFRSLSILLLKKLFMEKNVDFFLCTTANPIAGKLLKALHAKQISSFNLKKSLFIILSLEDVIKYFLKEKKLPFKNIVNKITFFALSYVFKRKLNSWKNKYSEKNIIKCKKIDGRFNNLWKKIKNINKEKILFNRDQKWLEWQLDYFIKNKKAWILISIENKKINGYAICIEKSNDADGLKRAFLIDLVSLNQKKNVSINLIGATINEANKRKCHIIEFRGFDELKKSYINFFNPFSRNLSNNQFYYKSNKVKLDNVLNKDKFWMPTYMDGDAITNF